ncbi:MAG TPA: BrnA antitoxin family protein [Allosphingosinicella sp.]|nr:BrnA antitoxin family protein [Allosphingosinicella sp.]
MSEKSTISTGPDRDDPPRFTREMAERGRHMVGDRVIREARPRGRPPKEAGERKEKVTLRLSPEVLSYFRAQGTGWQTRIDLLLTDHVRTSALPGGKVPFRKRASR